MAESSTAQGLQVGLVIADTYEVTGLIGRGGMGGVWAASHRRLPGKTVAIKVLHPDVAADAEALARFRREAEIASRLGHPNIVAVHDFNVLPDGTPYLILEHLHGESLRDRIRRAPLPVTAAIDILRQVGSALRTAHEEGIIHRDLKPQNIFLVPTESGGHVRDHAVVLDFGISKIRGSETIQTQTTAMLGTPQYMAPEQAAGKHDAVDPRTDVFALGAIAYEMLAGEPAFTGQSVPEVVFTPALAERAPAVPPAMVQAIERALEKKQEDRFGSVAAFIEALTGEPLATLRQAPAIDGVAETMAASTGQTPGTPKVHSADAVAATAASGQEPVVVRSSVGVSGTDRTVAASSPGTPAQPTADADVPAVSASVTQPVEPRKSRRSLVIGAGGALAGIAATVVAVLLLRPADRPAPGQVAGAPASAATATAPPDPTSSSDAPTPTPATPADRPTPAAVPDAAPPPPPAPASHRSDRRHHRRDRHHDRNPGGRRDDAPRSPPTAQVPAEVRRQLAAAERALASGHPGRAVFLANRAQHDQPTGAGFALKTRAYCAQGDLSNARANFLNVPRRLRRRVTRYCRRHEIDLE
jgi:serine/threonine-protein kinase